MCQVEKGKGCWIRKRKSKPLWHQDCNVGIRIGEDMTDRFFQNSSSDSNSSDEDFSGRVFVNKEVGECSEYWLNGSCGPTDVREKVGGPRNNKRTLLKFRRKARLQAQVKFLVGLLLVQIKMRVGL